MAKTDRTKSEPTPIDLGLEEHLNELFMNEQERAENRLPKIYHIPLSEIDEFPDHPFQVRMDEDMDQLVESVKERGVITPVTLRKKEDGRYETVSGHRRIPFVITSIIISSRNVSASKKRDNHGRETNH